MSDFHDQEDYVIKRNGNKEPVSFDKILKRLKTLGGDDLNVNYTSLCTKIIERLYQNITTTEIDECLAQQCASLSTTHPDYGILASKILISNHQKNTSDNYLEIINQLYNFKDINGEHSPLISKQLFNIIHENINIIQSWFDYERDYLLDYFGFKTLERAYLMRVNGVIIERPQHMWMRVSLGIHLNNLEKAKETYDLMSQKYFTHATPTLFNAGTPRPQLSSCYLLAMEDDSIKGIYNTLSDCASISKWAGGIGLHIHNIRAAGSHIRGTNGTSNGVVPMLRVFNNTARYVDQCVMPETYIYTTKGPKEIQYCSNETEIFTTNGKETIENVLEHPYTGDILNINTIHSFDNLKITPEHPVLCLKNQKKGLNYQTIKNRLEKHFIAPEWIDSKNLTLDDMLVFTIPNYEKDIQNISENDCYMYGLLLGDGCMNNNSTSSYISLHTVNKQHMLNFITNYLENKVVEYFIDTENNTTRIRWNKTINLPFRYSDLYDENKQKKINSKWLNLPISKSKYIVKGLIHSDGCISKEVTFDTTSKNLIESLRYILLRMGILTGGYIRDRIGETHTTKYGDVITNKLISYCLRIPKTKEIADLLNIEIGQFQKYFRYKNFLFTRISSITKEQYTGTLYDLQMRKTHNYMIHNGVIHNGGGKRAGSFAMYLEPWHGDIFEFLEMKKNHGDEEARARDLFYALWIPDLFMKRIRENKHWTLMCPDVCRGLSDVYGEEFEELYTKYENEGKGIKKVKARTLWFKILDSQIETGVPYLLYKDACNKKSNQKNLGTIKSSNLCTEIIEYSDDNETAVCNLASIGLSKFVTYPEHNLENVKIYTKDDCGWCLLMKSLLKSRDISYDEVHILEEKFEEFKSTHNVKTLPLLYNNDTQIGGYDALKEILKPSFDYDMLHKITKVVTYNLNKVIDINFYPTEKTRNSNLKHRPIGIGVQGLADAFALLDIAFHSEEAQEVNKLIFETMYHAALESSMEMSKKRTEGLKELYKMWRDSKFQFHEEYYYGKEKQKENRNGNYQYYHYHDSSPEVYNLLMKYKPMYNEFALRSVDSLSGAYSSFKGSPASKKILQFDMWNVTPSSKYDWTTLKENIQTYGMRNSLLLAPMPTASTSQILGNNECFEPFTSNIYLRRTLAGEFVIVNKHLLRELINMDLWNDTTKNLIIKYNGSIQNIPKIPRKTKDKYKIVWEIPMKHIINMSAERAAFICQSQSMNLWMKEPSYDKLTSMHFYSWKKGLKTGMYYLRTKAKAAPQQFTVEPEKNEIIEEDAEDCLMCGS